MSAPRKSPGTEYANWVLHRQPADQIADHKFSIWSGERPVVLVNEVPGEEGALAYIVSVLNGAESDKEAVKLAYVKRWRTIVKLPAKYADEIVEALRVPDDAQQPTPTELEAACCKGLAPESECACMTPDWKARLSPDTTVASSTDRAIADETWVTNNPDGSISLDAYAGKSRDELKDRCSELLMALEDWRFTAVSAATDGGNTIENVREPYRSKIAQVIEAYSDGDETPVSSKNRGADQ